ncbi:hypothetical protein C9374_005083 [Naegleria lovaniensis]|uniref:RNB domain-containing protein n=1 Tax=Naegleria lovaniensis TaxID=51637 RepID=A0AA88KK29_NAELO|nr:uncharacterized protein C9374_005083 [Naegleria lovaniensis]KAG2382503.1 hypothetical protein C9374_005083 [Naegleria lovaniensis]
MKPLLARQGARTLFNNISRRTVLSCSDSMILMKEGLLSSASRIEQLPLPIHRSSLFRTQQQRHFRTSLAPGNSKNTDKKALNTNDDDSLYLEENNVKGCIVEFYDKSTESVRLGLLDEKEFVIHQEDFTTIKLSEKLKHKDVVIIEKWTNVLITFNDLKEVKEKANSTVLDQNYYVDFELRLENLLIEAYTSGRRFTSSSLAGELFDSEVPSLVTRYIAFYLFEYSGCFKFDTRTNKYMVIETDASQMRIKDFVKRAQRRIHEVNEFKLKKQFVDQAIFANYTSLNLHLPTKWDPIIDVPILRKIEFFMLSNNENEKNRGLINTILETFGYPKTRKGAALFLHAVGHLQLETSASFLTEEGPSYESIDICSRRMKEIFPSFFKPFSKESERLSQFLFDKSSSIIEKEKLNPVRRDLRHLKAIAIDDITTQAYDDAISVEPTPTGFKLYVHVCDISSFITKNSPLEVEARSKMKTLYGKNRLRLMLHPNAIRSATLNPDRENLALTLEIIFSKNGSDFKLDRYEFYRSTLGNIELYTYNMVDNIYGQYIKKKLAKNKKNMEQSTRMLTDVYDVAVDIDKVIEIPRPSITSPSRDVVTIIMTIANSILEAHIKRNNLQHLFPSTTSYIRFTSPLRRYADLATHLQFVALLEHQQTKDIDESKLVYTEKEIKQINSEIQTFEKDLAETEMIIERQKREVARKDNLQKESNQRQTSQSAGRVVGQVVKKRKGMSNVYIQALDKTVPVHLVEYDEVKMIELVLNVLPESETASFELLGWPSTIKKMRENRVPNDIKEGSKVVLNVKSIDYNEVDGTMKHVIVEHCFEEKVDNYSV